MKNESILVVTRNFPPLSGGMERLMDHTVQSLSERAKVTLIGPKGCRAHCPSAVQVIECPPGAAPFLISAMLKGIWHCLSRRYSLVIGGSGLMAPVTIALSVVGRARSAVHVHGLDLVVDSIIYQTLFVPCIARNAVIIANSHNTRSLAIARGCDPSRTSVINPGVQLRPEPDSTLEDSRQSLGLTDEKIALFVGRIVRRKGLTPFVQKSWPAIASAEPRAKLLVVGDTPDNALNGDPDEASNLGRALSHPRIGESIRFMGPVTDETLWQYYEIADVLVFPLIEVSGDVEGFGMVAIEAAACGTPTITFAEGGVTDAVADGISGHVVTAGDYRAFTAATLGIFQTGNPSAENCRKHARRFSWERHKEKLFSLLLDDMEI